jgi:hypothetical protein
VSASDWRRDPARPSILFRGPLTTDEDCMPEVHASESDLGALLTERFPYAFPRLLIFRRNVVNVETRDGWRARAGVKGQSDYYVMGARVHVEIETKLLQGKWYKQQIAWRDRCAALDIPYLIARPAKGETSEQTVTRWLEEIGALVSC